MLPVQLHPRVSPVWVARRRVESDGEIAGQYLKQLLRRLLQGAHRQGESGACARQSAVHMVTWLKAPASAGRCSPLQRWQRSKLPQLPPILIAKDKLEARPRAAPPARQLGVHAIGPGRQHMRQAAHTP